MKFDSILEIYRYNDAIRGELMALLEGVDPESEGSMSTAAAWSVRQNVEHLQMVEAGMVRICAKLLKKAENANEISDGSVAVTEGFLKVFESDEEVKLEAPDIVRPTGNQSISDSVSKMSESRKLLSELRPKFEKFDANSHKFPHPIFGYLSAAEWLMLIGLHEARHLGQIRRIVDALG